jgi:SPP1 gp7 family putative phage head morphogenesis protein
MATKPKTVRAIHANRGIESRYKKALDELIKEMSNSAEYWLAAQYRKAPPEVAMDALPAAEMSAKVRELSKRWIGKFNDMAADIAKRFASGSIKATDNSFQSALKDAGWAVDFKMTRAMQDVAKAAVMENVALIKSIPRQYFLEVEGIVMRGYSRGRDLQEITNELQSRYGVTRRRAVLIARDQANKLNAVTTQARRQELGITEAIWQHSHGGKEPRKSHVAADGRKFEIAKGCLIDGKHILPGEEINCRCVSKSVLPF